MKVLRDRIVLTGDELAVAIEAYLVAHEVNVHGPRTINIVVDGDRPLSKKFTCCDVDVEITVAPEGVLIDNRG